MRSDKDGLERSKEIITRIEKRELYKFICAKKLDCAEQELNNPEKKEG